LEIIMKKAVFAVGILCLGLSACASMSAGNPNNDAYIGSPDSVYDTSANPARIIGSVAYDPNAPLPGTIPPIGADGSAMPATPTPQPPAP
jgi:hypothetical protein